MFYELLMTTRNTGWRWLTSKAIQKFIFTLTSFSISVYFDDIDTWQDEISIEVNDEHKNFCY